MDIRCEFTDMVDVGALVPNPKNANTHGERQISILAKNIEHQGFRHPIIVSKLSGFIAAGHGRLMAAQSLGMEKVPVDYQDFKNEADEFRFMIADNKISSLATHDDNLMIEGIKGLDLIDSDFELLGLDDFLLPLDPDAAKDEIEDDIPTDVETRCKLGDVWTLGEHRLVCGDSTDVLMVEKLMDGDKADMVFTDPPYGMDYQLNTTKNIMHKIIGDSVDFDFKALWSVVFEVPIIYICTRFDKYVDWQNQTTEKVKNIIVWKKSNMGAGDLKNYGYQHEFIMYFGKSIDGKRDTNVWEEGNVLKKEYVNHPTQKPISLIQRAINNHKASNVLDLFGGSGSTLIACEKTNRKCYMAELDPKYCDVIIARFEKYSGKAATRVT